MLSRRNIMLQRGLRRVDQLGTMVSADVAPDPKRPSPGPAADGSLGLDPGPGGVGAVMRVRVPRRSLARP